MKHRRASLRHWALPISLSLLIVVIGAQAQDSIKKLRQFPDNTWLVEIDGQEMWAVGPARAKILHDAELGLPQCEADLKQTQGDLQKAKDNVQDERVKYGKLETLYKDQSVLFQSCMALSKNGSKLGSFLDHPVVKLITTAAPPVINAATCR